MSGNLLGLAYGSSSEDEEPEHEEAGRPSDQKESGEDSDSESGSDSDDSETEKKKKASTKDKEDKRVKPATTSSGLPAALDLLETVAAPSFLEQPKREPEVTPIFRPSFAHKKQEPGHWNKKRPSSSTERPPPVTSQPPAPPKASFPPPSQGGAQASKKPKTDKGKDKDVKERVKNQRLSGQSGIGEDFRVWRSEDEMRMRQGFD